MTKPGKRSFFGNFFPFSPIFLLLALLWMPLSASAQSGTMEPSAQCPDILLHSSYRADVDDQCRVAGPHDAVCSSCTCVQMLKGPFEKARINQQILTRKESVGEIIPYVHQVNDYLQNESIIWCRVNFFAGPGLQMIMTALATISSLSDLWGLAAAAITAAMLFALNTIVNMLVNLACQAIADVLNFLASLICIPFIDLSITLPRFLFRLQPNACNGYPLGTFTGVPPPPPPLIYSSIPRIIYRSKVHVITP